MKWFKHLTGEPSDPDFSLYMEKVKKSGYGKDGYYVFFRTQTLMAREFSISTPGIVIFPKTFLVDKLKMRWPKIEKILTLAGKLPRNKGIFIELDGEMVHLNCPRLKELADEYTEKQLKKLGLLPSKKSGQTPDSTSGQYRDKLRPTEQEQTTDIDIDTVVKQKGIVVENSVNVFNSLELLSFVSVVGCEGTYLAKNFTTDQTLKAIKYALKNSKKNPGGMVIRALRGNWQI